MPDRYEGLVQKLFRDRFALDLRKIRETSLPTPDFDVFAGAEHVAVLEVKALKSSAVTPTPEELGDGNFIPAALSRDTIAGRVAAKVHEAVTQFEGAVLPKILVFFNDGEADDVDLHEGLRGYMETEDGDRIPAMSPSARRRVIVDRSKIDLYVWVSAFPDDRLRLVSTGSVGRSLKARYFGLPPRSGQSGLTGQPE